MKKPETPHNESKRQAALCGLNILDTPAEARFDRITRVAQQHFQVSIALVSLVDEDRQWFKSRQGLDATETPRDISFCGHAILSGEIFYIPNTLEDSRFADNPLVTGPPNIRFYAGAPLHAPDGKRVGTLCIIDDKPREFSDEEFTVLRDLADGVEEELKHGNTVATHNARHIHPIAAVSLILGGLFSLLFFLLASQIEKDQIRLTLQTLADERRTALAIELESVEDVMHGVVGLYEASTHVDPQEFVAFLKRAFPKKSEIQSAIWIEHVAENDIESFYQQASNDGYADFRLQTVDANNALVTAAPQPENYVVYHVYNREQHQWLAGGLNLSTLPAYKTILQQAATSEKLVSNKSFDQSQDHSGKTFELFLPVYHLQNTSASGAAEKKQLRGFIGLLLDVGNSLEEADKRRVSKAGGLDVYVVDNDARRSKELLYFHPSRARTSDMEALPVGELELGHYVATDIDFADTRWRMVLRPIPGRYESGKAAGPWLTLTGGLLFTLMVAGYLNTLQRRRVVIEQQVQLRTSELNDSRERIRAVIGTVVDGIVTINAQGIVQSFNPAAEKIFGYPAESVIDQNVNMLMPDPYTKEHDGYLHHYISTGEKKVIGIGREVMGKRKDSSTFPMELAVSEMQINGERMFTGIVRDITERKRAEQEFQEMNAIRQGILDSANFTIITTNTEGLIQTFNQGAERNLGYNEDEMVGKQSPAIMHDLDEVVARAAELSKELGINIEPGFEVFVAKARMGEADENEWTYVRKDGSRFPVLLSVTAIRDNENKIKAFLGIGFDITERKKIENIKSEFISTVSHELRTPLTSIRGALGLVLGRSADQLSDKARNMLEMANRNSERLTLLINDILDLEKIESGRLEFDFATVDLVALSRRALEDNEGYAQNHQVKLQLDTTLDMAPVWGDEHRLLQVFANLISNAVKYSPKDGQVEISVNAHEGGYRVAVRDHGKGIPEEFHGRIFQRFAQADSSDTREKGGTGLGLSITKAIVEFHKGDIGYESEPDKGTVFNFDLPSSAQASMQENPEETTGIRVLICEDNADVAAILAEMLQSAGVVSDIAVTAEAARTLLGKYAYRLLLLDLTLPDADGLQFLQELRATPATAELPVIVVSGRAEEGRISFKGDAVTVVDWLQKPIDQARLERALREALQRSDRPRILHVEDDFDIVQVTQSLLEEMADVSHVPSLVEARQRLATEEFDLVILDLGLADGSGLELLDELKGRCPVVIFSAQIPGREVSEQVTAALTKSMTSNEQLLATIMKVLEG